MEEKKEKKTIKCSYALLVIILFATVAFLTDYIIIDRKTRKCDCPKCEATSNEVISDNTDNTQITEEKKDNSFCEHATTNVCANSVFELIGRGQNYILDDDFNIRTLSDKISLVNNFKYADIEVVDGSLVFKIHEYSIDSIKGVVLDDSSDESMTYNIPGEKIKYIYTYYYQPSGDTFIYLLTDNNNLYRSNYKHLIKENEFNFNNVIDFKLIYSNVSDMKLIDVPSEYCYDNDDCTHKEFYVDIDGENVKVKYHLD
ncbi:MAG: hypothetical protein ACI31V_03120 [Bacilli bacterium]